LQPDAQNVAKFTFLHRATAAVCRSASMEWLELAGTGELITYTVINVKPQSFSHYPDYAVGIAKMPQGVNVLAWIDGDIKSLKAGMKVKLEVKRESLKIILRTG